MRTSSLFHRFSAWVFAFLSVGCILLLASCGLRGKEDIHIEVQAEERFSLDSDELLLVSGRNPESSVEHLLTQLYGKDTDDRRIADAVLASLTEEVLGEELPLLSTLHSLGDIPFTVMLREDEGGKKEWLVMLSDVGQKNFASILHQAFTNRFPRGKLRERTMPSGRVVRDVLIDDEAVISTEESWRNVQITRSTHIASAESLLTGIRGDTVYFGNSRALLLQFIHEKVPKERPLLLLHEAGLFLLTDAFPDSDLLRYARAFLIGKEDILSLSSFECLP